MCAPWGLRGAPARADTQVCPYKKRSRSCGAVQGNGMNVDGMQPEAVYPIPRLSYRGAPMCAPWSLRSAPAGADTRVCPDKRCATPSGQGAVRRGQWGECGGMGEDNEAWLKGTLEPGHGMSPRDTFSRIFRFK
jgi:hypothetical protein